MDVEREMKLAGKSHRGGNWDPWGGREAEWPQETPPRVRRTTIRYRNTRKKLKEEGKRERGWSESCGGRRKGGQNRKGNERGSPMWGKDAFIRSDVKRN